MLGKSASFLAISLILADHASGQVEKVPYRHIVDISDQIKGPLDTADYNEGFQITDLSISANKWAALVSFRKLEINSVLVSGDLGKTGVSVRRLTYRPDKIALDGRNRMYLQGDQRGGAREKAVFELEDSGDLREIAQIPDSMLTPLRSGETVFWSGTEGVWQERGGRVAKIKPSSPTKELVLEVENERRFSLGLPGGRHLVLRDRSERVTVYDASGLATSTATLSFDQAYASVGHTSAPVDLHLVGSGRTRVVWTATSSTGELYVYLSDMPVVGPGYLAVFNPTNGAFIRMLSLDLPKGISSRVFSENPGGTIIPTIGNIYDGIVVADPHAGIIAFY